MGKSPEIPTVSLERLPDGIYMSPIRPSVCPQDIYKTNETSSCTSSQIWHTPNNLLGRHFVHEPNSYRASAGHVNSNSFIRKPRFCNKLNKISTEANQTLEFLGFIVDTKNMTLALPQGKVTEIKDLCSQMLSQTELTVRDIIGKLIASIQAIFPAPLHYRQLQSLKNIALQSGGELQHESQPQSCMSRGSAVVESTPECLERPSHITPPPDLVIETDASQQGWGAVCKEVRTGGLWSQNERLLHINCLELLAGAFAVKCFTKNQICLHVRLRMDNTTAIAYLNKLGETRSLVLSNLVAELWS